MRDLILNKIKELEEEKKTYYEILENSKMFSESYIIGRIRSARDKIDVLNELLEEVDENVRITDKTILWIRIQKVHVRRFKRDEKDTTRVQWRSRRSKTKESEREVIKSD